MDLPTILGLQRGPGLEIEIYYYYYYFNSTNLPTIWALQWVGFEVEFSFYSPNLQTISALQGAGA